MNRVEGTGVRLTGLHKSFGEVHAVDGIDVDIAAGETVAILGPNGAGKSTTIDMMLGLTKPDAGEIEVFGMSPNQAVAAGAIGAMLQTGQLLRDLTVRELVEMVASFYANPRGVDEVLELTRITPFADRKTQKLSGGETQRTRFAVALVGNPKLLVLDEPTVALDVEGRRDFWATMRNVTQGGSTVVFATHYLDEADEFADRIVLMAKGRVVADGPTTEIKAKVGGRVIRATLPDASADALRGLPGVTSVEVRGDTVAIMCADSDSSLRAFLGAYPSAADIEVVGAGLEAAFLELTLGEEAAR